MANQVGDRNFGVLLNRNVSTHALQDRVVRATRRIRSRFSVTTDRAIDEVGVLFEHCVCPEAEALHHARAKVFDQNIRTAHQVERDLEPFFLMQVEHDAALASVYVCKHRGQATAAIPLVSQQVAAPWRFDLNDVGTLVCQHHGRKRPRNDGRKVDDSNSRQRPRHTQTTRWRRRERPSTALSREPSANPRTETSS